MKPIVTCTNSLIDKPFLWEIHSLSFWCPAMPWTCFCRKGCASEEQLPRVCSTVIPQITTLNTNWIEVSWSFLMTTVHVCSYTVISISRRSVQCKSWRFIQILLAYSSFSKANLNQANYSVYEIKTHHYKSEYFL